MSSYCEAFVKKLNDENAKFIGSNSKLPFKFEIKKDKNMTVIENVFEALGAVTGMGDSKSKFSFMSPRLFSILPAANSDKRKHLLSPTLFSFYEKDGFFPLPDILKKFNVEQGAEKDWLETLLDISGTTGTLEKIVKDMEPQMKEMNEKVYPAILEIQNIEENWRLVSQSYTNEQQNDMKENGYAFLEPEQMQLLYSRGSQSKLNIDFNEYAKLSKEERQKRIDADIRQLAKMNVKEEEEKFNKYKKRRKRQVEVHENGEITTNAAGPHHDYSQEADDGHGGHAEHGPIHFITLEPWAFGSKIGHGAALEAITLSPHAFFTEILMPEALILQTLGPRAFIPSILSPNALMGRILSPAAFRAEVLSPRALTAFILTPEALIAEVLSPKFLELRILSPEALIIEVLSPSIIAPRILSPEAGAILILSPFILSPRVLSGHALTVEVLSPHLLGGDHSEHEDHDMGKPHDHKPGENVEVHDLLGQGEHGHETEHGHAPGHQDEHGPPIHPIVSEGGHGALVDQEVTTTPTVAIETTNHDSSADGFQPQVEVHNHDDDESLLQFN
uniref:Uncharacterized protein n=1 Tax=Panagrolaimus sp. ES5 TaxID=591445 RepID=A0AC34FVK2_9BILA